MAYDSDNVFAKILRGELPAHKVYEDTDTLALHGHHAEMRRPYAGHSRRRRCAMFSTPATRNWPLACGRSGRWLRRRCKAFGADGITLLQANERAGGQVVFHMHFHVMPRWDGRPLGPPAANMEKPEALAANAEKIRKALAA